MMLDVDDVNRGDDDDDDDYDALAHCIRTCCKCLTSMTYCEIIT